MATRMQQRRGTAAQWISTNGGAGPVLNAGEMGWESDTNKFKIGDGVNNWTSLDYFSDINSTVNPAFGTSIVFEGATADSFETTLQVTDPTADRTITLPNVTGTVITTGNLSDITDIGVFTSTIVMEGSTADSYELTLSAGDPTADRTITFPDSTGTVALTSDITVTASSTTTFSNKSISLGSNTITSTLAQLNTAISDADVASLTGAETLTNKTLTSPVISSITNGAATLTLPTSTGTVALTTDIPAGVVTTSDSGTVTSTMISNGTIVNEDINASAAIAQSKIADLTTDLAAKASLSGATFTGAVSGTDLTLSGNLTVNGTTTNINSTNLVVEDKNIILADVGTPTDVTADGGGITLKGTTDKTFNWVDSTDSWTSSEHLFLSATKELRLADTDSSHYVGFKAPSTVSTNKIWTLPSVDGTAGYALTTDGSGTLSWSAAGGGGAAFSEFMLIGA